MLETKLKQRGTRWVGSIARHARGIMPAEAKQATSLGHSDYFIRGRESLGPIEPNEGSNGHTWSGFLIGAGGSHVDYRTSALSHHWPGHDGGILVALEGSGTIIFRDNAHGDGQPRSTQIRPQSWPMIEY